MRKLIAALILSIATTQAGAAPATAESIERLLVVTKVESMMDSVYAGMDQIMRQSLRQAAGGRQLTPEQQQLLEQLPARFVSAMREEFTWARMKPHYIRIYQESFEQVEIDGLIAFYQTPAGRALVSKMPVVMQKSIALGQELMRTMIPRINRTIEEGMKDAKIIP